MMSQEELEEANRQLALSQAEQFRLQAQVENLKTRLSTTRNVAELLRERLAKERAARAVLSARIIASEAEEQKEMERRELEQIRRRGAQMGPDLHREHNALVDLVAALYRNVQAPPPTLEAAAAIEGDAVGQAKRAPTITTGRSIRWYQFLVGKMTGTKLEKADGQLIAEQGQMITPEIVAAADEGGLLFDLARHMRMPPSDTDL